MIPVACRGSVSDPDPFLDSSLPNMDSEPGWAQGWCADPSAPAWSTDSHGPACVTISKVFATRMNLRVLLYCCRPGVTAVYCIHRLAVASPGSAPTDCTWPHHKDGKLFQQLASGICSCLGFRVHRSSVFWMGLVSWSYCFHYKVGEYCWSFLFQNKIKCEISTKWRMKTTIHGERSLFTWIFHPPSLPGHMCLKSHCTSQSLEGF